MVVQSWTATCVKRRKTGTATGSAASTTRTAASTTSRRHSADAWLKRSSSACGVSGTPSVAAVCTSCDKRAWGWASQPNTSVCTNRAPVNFEARCTRPVARAARSATGPRIVCIARATCGIVAIGRSFGLSRLLQHRHDARWSVPLPPLSLSLMRMGCGDDRPHSCGGRGRAGVYRGVCPPRGLGAATRLRLRELLPPALAACPDAAAWRALVRRIEALVEGQGLLGRSAAAVAAEWRGPLARAGGRPRVGARGGVPRRRPVGVQGTPTGIAVPR